MKQKPLLRTHAFVEDPATSAGAREPYCTCGRPKSNARHDLPPQTPEQRAFDAARLGERTDR